MELAHFLDLTLVQESERCEVLYNLTPNYSLSHTLISTMEAVSCLHFTVAVIVDMHTFISMLPPLFISLKENVNALYDYMRAFASILINPCIVHPGEPQNILVE